jgi:DNA-binding beta-propeller fold protein YncE
MFVLMLIRSSARGSDAPGGPCDDRGGRETLGFTPDGSQLWVGQGAAAKVTVIDTATGATASVINLRGDVAQSADGYEPTGIALTATSTPGS